MSTSNIINHLLYNINEANNYINIINKLNDHCTNINKSSNIIESKKKINNNINREITDFIDLNKIILLDNI